MNFRDLFAAQDRISILKREARKHYEAHRAIASRYDCGLAMASHINPDLQRHAGAFNAAMDELATLDDTCPKGRL